MVIRNFTETDASNVLEFHERVLKQTGTFAHGPWNDDMQDIYGTYVKAGGCFIIAEEDNEMIGMGALRIISQGQAEIKRMRIDPSRQWQGIGQQIFDYLIAYAKERNITRVILDTTELQIAAQKFYQKNGFNEYRRNKWNELTLILYEKSLLISQ